MPAPSSETEKPALSRKGSRTLNKVLAQPQSGYNAQHMWQIEETDRRIIVHLNPSRIFEQSQIDTVGNGLLSICCRAKVTGKKLVINFDRVEEMSSRVIGTLIMLNKYARSNEVRLRMANVRAGVLEVFKITRMNKVFIFDDGEDDAEFLGAPVPRPDKPDSDNEHAK